MYRFGSAFMKTLFISSYSGLLTIGILSNGKVVTQKEEISERSHSAHLIPLIESTLKVNKLEINDINEIIVVNGPGSFTGVRLGITVAKTLGFTLKIPIKTITSIEALAISDDNQNKKIVTIDDSKGKYFAIFENNNLLGEINYLLDSKFKEFYQKNKHSIVKDNKLNIAVIYEYLKDGKMVNPHQLKPIYIKTIEVEK